MTSIPITLPWINYSYAEALFFVSLKGCSPQIEVKSRKTKENRISHLQENGPHSSHEGNPYIKTNLDTGCFRKIAKKRGTQMMERSRVEMRNMRNLVNYHAPLHLFSME